MTNSLDQYNPKKLIAKLKDKTVKDLSDIDLIQSDLDPGELNLGDAKLTIKADAKAQLFALNSAGDKDEDGVFGPDDASSDDDFDISPRLQFTQGQAWLKYLIATSADVGLSWSGNTGSLPFTLGAKGKAGVRISSYRHHHADSKATEAVKEDLKDFGWILNSADIKKLQNGDAMALNTHGSLEANLKLSWSDVFSTSLSTLSRLLNTSAPLLLDVETGATFTAGVKVDDAYKLIITRPDQNVNRVQIAVFKGNTNQREVAFSASIGAKFNNPQVLENALNALVQNLFTEIHLSEIKALLAKASMEELSSKERKLVEKLLEKLGLNGPLEKLAELRTKWDGLKQAVHETATEMVREVQGESDALQEKIQAEATRVLNRLLQSTTVTTVDALVDQHQLEDLPEDEQKLALHLLEHLGLRDSYEETKEFLDQWDHLKAKATDAVNSLAEQLTDGVENIESSMTGFIKKIQEALMGNDVTTTIDAFLAKANQEHLVELTTDELDELLKQLGISKVIDNLQKLQAVWTRFEGKIASAIATVANTEAKLSFSYEYQRLETNKALLEFYADTSLFDTSNALHTNLIHGWLSPIVDELRAGKTGLELINYLEENTVETKQNWGLRLDLGKWGFGGMSHVVTRETTRKNITGTMENLSVGRNYVGTVGFNSFNWGISLKADMNHFSPNPSASDPNYAMLFVSQITEKRLNDKDLARALDQAIIWGSLGTGTESELAQATGQLQHIVGRQVTVASSINLNNEAFRSLLPYFGAPSSGFGASMAAGMLFNSSVSSVLAHPNSRIQIYSGLWTAYLSHLIPLSNRERERQGGHRSWTKRIQRNLRNDRSLRIRERRANSGVDPFTMTGQLKLSKRLIKKYEGFANGMAELNQAITQRGDFSLIESAFDEADNFFTQTIWVRALGHYALRILRNLNNGQLKGAECTTTFTYKDDTEVERVITLGSNQRS